MAGVENKNIEQNDIAEQSKQAGSQERIEQALQSRLKGRDDEQELAPKFLNLFQDPKIQESFSTDQLVKYISNMNVDRLLQEISFDDKEADVDSLLGYIDIAANEPVTDTYVEIQQENTEKDVTNSNIEWQTSQKETSITHAEIFQKKLQEAQKAYADLDPKLLSAAQNIQPEDVMSPSILAQIGEKIKGTGLDLKEYVQFTYAADQIKQDEKDGKPIDAKSSLFLEKFDDLKWSVEEGVVRTAADLSPKKINATATTLLNENESVKNYINNDALWDKKVSKPAYFEQKRDNQEADLLIEKFADKDTQQKLQDLKEKFLANAVDLNNNKDYQTYVALKTATTEDIQKNLWNTLQTLMKQGITVSQVCGMMKYLDTSTAQDKNFANNIELNVQNDIQVDAAQGNLHVSWYMNTSSGPKYIGFSQDMYKNNPIHGNLRADDYLSHDKNGSAFVYRGQGTVGESELHVNFPTTDQLSIVAQSFANNAKIETLIKNSTSLEDFQTMFSNQLRDRLLNSYGDQALVKQRIKRQVEKNVAAQELQSSWFSWAENKTISKSTTENAWNISKKFDDFLEDNTPEQVMKLRTANKKLDDIIKKWPDPKSILEPEWKNLITQLQAERESGDIDDEWFSATTKLFHYVSNAQDKLHLTDFENLVTILWSSTETVGKHMNSFSSSFKAHLQEEKDVADIATLEKKFEEGNFA